MLLLDTYSLVFRAFHALPEMNTSRGEATSALYGFSVLLLKLLKEQRPSGLAFALDAPKRTFRHEQYAYYKGTRDRAPPPLVEQLRRLPTLLQALSVPLMCVPGYEADDVLATLATQLSARDERVLIVTGDRDLLQLVSDRVRVWFVGARGQKPVCFDPDKVVERFGVTPERLPSFAALVGDVSDNLPGVRGVGPATAAKLVREFGTVDEILAHVENVEPERLRHALQENAAQVRLNEQLTRLRRDVPLPEGPLAGTPQAAAFAQLNQIFVELEFRSLVPRLSALAPDALGPRPNEPEASEVV